MLGSVRYHVGGEGEPLLLIHGLAGSTGNWVELLPDLVQRYRVLAVDLPGHAGSAAAAARRVDRRLRGGRSGGARAGVTGATRSGRGPFVRRPRRAPARAEPARARARAPARVAGRDRDLQAGRPGDRADLDDDPSGPLRRPVPPPLRRARLVSPGRLPAVVRLGRRRADAAGRRSACSTLSASTRTRGAAARAMCADDPRRDLGAIWCPVARSSGARATPSCRSSDAFEYARRLRARLRIVADCGHLVIVERPAAVLDALRYLRSDRKSGSARQTLKGRFGPTSPLSDRVVDLDELPLEPEALGEVARERLHAEPLGRVVAGGDEVDPELAGGLQARLLGLAGEEQVVALVRRLDQRARRRRPSRSRSARSAPARARRRAARVRPPSRGCGRRARRCRSARAGGRPGRPRRRAARPRRRARRRGGRCCRSSDARRARGGRRGASGRRRRAPRAGRAGAGRSTGARSARTSRGGRSAAARLRRPLAGRARATPTRRRRSCVTSSAPSTCSPGRPYSGKRCTSSSSFA